MRSLKTSMLSSALLATLGTTLPSSTNLLLSGTECAGINAKKYIGGDALHDLVTKDFCPTVAAQTSWEGDSQAIMRRYYKATMDDVLLSIHAVNGAAFIPIKQSACESYMTQFAQRCNPANDKENPGNYKGGGHFVIQGGKETNVEYRIEPQAERQPAEDGVTGGCHCEFADIGEKFTLWGHGFLSHDFGESVHAAVKSKCDLRDETWSFEYGLGDAGQEWNATFKTTWYKVSCVQDAVNDHTGAPSLKCGGQSGTGGCAMK